MIGFLFNKILYQPLFNGLILLYQYLPGHDLGLAIVVLTGLIRLLLYPISASALKAQSKVSKLQSKVKQIKKQYQDQKKQTQALLDLYQKENISPFSSFLPLLVQLPVLIALYRVFLKGVKSIDSSLLYSFVLNPGGIEPYFLGVLNLTNSSPILAGLAAFFQFLQTKFLSKRGSDSEDSKDPKDGDQPDFSQIFKKQSTYIFPALTFIILLKVPSAVGLYLITTTLFSLVQQKLI